MFIRATELRNICKNQFKRVQKVRSTETVGSKTTNSNFLQGASHVTGCTVLIINSVTVLRTFENRFVFVFYKRCQSYGLG